MKAWEVIAIAVDGEFVCPDCTTTPEEEKAFEDEVGTWHLCSPATPLEMRLAGVAANLCEKIEKKRSMVLDFA